AQPATHQGAAEHSDGWCKTSGGEGCDRLDISILGVEQETKDSATMSATHPQGSDLAGQRQGGFQQGIRQYCLVGSSTQRRCSADSFQVTLPQAPAQEGKGFAMLGSQLA